MGKPRTGGRADWRAVYDYLSVHLFHISDTLAIAMIFKVKPSAGQPIYIQLIQQIRHAIETGLLVDGQALPAIRSMALDLVVSPNTIVKAYSELEHEGLVELRHGSGVYVSAKRRVKSRTDLVRAAQARLSKVIENLRGEGFSDEEIHRMVEAELFYASRI